MNTKADPATFLAEFNSAELLNLLADGAYITDTDRRILFWNDAAQKITGWSAKEVVGRHCRDNILVHIDKDGHSLCGEEHCPLHRCIVTGHPSVEPMLIFAQHRGGSRVPVEVTVAPIRNHAGEVIGGIEVFRDLTETVRDQIQAKEIQDMSVKTDLPRDDRVTFEVCYEPREIVGGDFLRIEPLTKDQYALLVADMRGHGVAAALYTMCVRSLWNEHRSLLTTPAQFVGVINDRFHALVRGSGYFGTAVLACYNAATGDLRVVRAGHPVPLLFREQGKVEEIGCSNPALGLLANPIYKETTAQLSPGDALLLYSDGAIEVFDREDHELGKEGLEQLVRKQTGGGTVSGFHLHQLEKQLLEYSTEIHLSDDLTLIKLSRLK